MDVQIDTLVTMGLNQAVGANQFFDRFVVFATNTAWLKMGPLLALVVYLWSLEEPAGTRRCQLIAGLVGAFLAMGIARILQEIIPSVRPLHELAGFHLPVGMAADTLEGRNSFPSDTTTLAFAIATIVYLQNRKLGILSLVWAAIFVSAPRIYTGLHYLSDVLAGAALASVMVVGTTKLLARQLPRIFGILEGREPLVASLGFLLLFSMGTMFNDLRALGRLVVESL